MLKSRLLQLALLGILSVLCLSSGALAQGEGAQGEAGHAEAPHKSTLEMSNKDIFNSLHGHSVPHAVFPHPHAGEKPPAWAIYNVNVWQLISTVIVLLIMLGVASSFNKSGRPGWVTRVFRGWCRWVRDDMVYAVMGKEEGRAFVPYFLFVFFFVAGMNVIGLIPSVTGVVEVSTATSTPYVTGPLALITFGMMLFFGMKKHGALGYIKGLLPHGLPAPLIPLMLVVELVGQIVKPFALMIRLFANMLAGHLVIASMIGLVFVFTKMFEGGALSYGPAILATGMATFIYIIEAFVTLLQAYIFTYLSIIFVHQAIHQDH